MGTKTRPKKAGDVDVPPLPDREPQPMTMAEKVLARHLLHRPEGALPTLRPGDAVLVEVDGGYSHDFTSAQVHYFRSVADATKIPLMIYNWPQATGLDITPEAVREEYRKAFEAFLDRYRKGAADARIDYAWSGQLAVTRDRLPHFGRIGANGFFVQGFSQ